MSSFPVALELYGTPGKPSTYFPNMVIAVKLSREKTYAEFIIINSVVTGPNKESCIFYYRELYYLKELCGDKIPDIKPTYMEIFSHSSRNSLIRVIDKSVKFYFSDLKTMKSVGWTKIVMTDIVYTVPIDIFDEDSSLSSCNSGMNTF